MADKAFTLTVCRCKENGAAAGLINFAGFSQEF